MAGKVRITGGGNESMMNKPELLLPAGDFATAKLAIDHGADAVYVGLSRFSARAKAKNFTQEEMADIIEYAHKKNAKIFCALNILLFNDELEEAIVDIAKLVSYGIDAFIVQDFGIASLIMAHFPETEVHASTQMAIMNVNGVQTVEALGFDRVVLARETSMPMMQAIRKSSAIDLEVFVQGALCVSYSGLCQMSSFQGDRSGNRGQCAQPCRRRYSLFEDCGKNRRKVDENYLLSPKDMNLLTDLPELLKIPVQSFKIEGRMKQPEYVALMTDVYRKHIDGIQNNVKFPLEIVEQDVKKMASVFNREGFSSAYLLGIPGKSMMSYHTPKNTGIPLGEIKKITKTECYVLLHEPLHTGDGVAIYDNALQSLWGGYIDNIRDENGKSGKAFFAGDLIAFKHGISDAERLNEVAYCYKTFDKNLSKELLKVKLFPEKSFEKYGVLHFYIQAVSGQPFSMDVLLEDTKGTTVPFHWESEYVVEQAKNGKPSVEIIDKVMHKLTNTGFTTGAVEINEPEACFIPMSVLTNGKNAAVAFYDNYLLNTDPAVTEDGENELSFDFEERKEECLSVLDEIPPQILIHHSPKISVQVRTMEQAMAALSAGIDELNVLLMDTYQHDGLSNSEIAYLAKNRKVIVSLPPIMKETNEEAYFSERCKDLIALGVKDFMVSNLGQIKLLEDLGIEYTAGDYQLNVTNDVSAAALSQIGISRQTVSLEMDYDRMSKLSSIGNIPLELIVYGRLPAMNTRYCPMGCLVGARELDRKCNRPCRAHQYFLERDGKEYELASDCFCNVYLLNDRLYSLFKHLDVVSNLCLEYWRIAGAFMKPNELREAAKTLVALREQIFGTTKKEQSIVSLQVNTTDGHFIKGVR